MEGDEISHRHLIGKFMLPARFDHPLSLVYADKSIELIRKQLFSSMTRLVFLQHLYHG